MRYFDAPQLEPQRKPLVPHKMISGMLPGATQIRLGGNSGILIDGKNQRVTVTSASGDSAGIGIIPGTTAELGFFSTDTDGNVVWKRVGPSGYIYDQANGGVNIIRDGKLPDDSYGQVIAKEGIDIADVFD